MTDIDVIVPVGARTDELTALHRRRSEALRAAGTAAIFRNQTSGLFAYATTSRIEIRSSKTL